MDKPVAAIELGSKKIKLVVGYELDGQVYVLYAATKNYGYSIEAGKILNKSAVIQKINEFKSFSDPSVKLNLNISEALLSLPPYGLEVLETNQSTSLCSDDGKVCPNDIRMIYNRIRNGTAGMTNELVEIIPQLYKLSNGEIYTYPPLEKESNGLSALIKIHTLPRSITSNYREVMTSGDISTKRTFVAPFSACELLKSYKDIESDYILVDIGSNMTTVSLIGNQILYESRFFQWGGDNITDKIVEKVGINESDAEKYKILYGFNSRKLDFEVPFCKIENPDGTVSKHYLDELNDIMKEELNIFVQQYESALDSLLEKYGNLSESYKKLPLIIVGGGGQLNGLIEYITPKVPNQTVKFVMPRSMGARNPTFTNCLGMILANARIPNVYDENHPRVGKVTRDPE